MIKSFRVLIINIVLLLAIFLGIISSGFSFCAVNNISEGDGAVLTRFFAVTDLTLNDISDNLQLSKIAKEQAKQSKKDIFGNGNDLIISMNFFGQLSNNIFFLFVVSVICIYVFFNFNFCFMFYFWRSILVTFLSKILFSLLPRSVSIKFLLLNILPCALFFKHKVFYLV